MAEKGGGKGKKWKTRNQLWDDQCKYVENICSAQPRYYGLAALFNFWHHEGIRYNILRSKVYEQRHHI